MKKLADQVLAEQVLAAYDSSDRHIPDSDLDDEQPVSLHVRTTLGDIRFFRRAMEMRARGAELVAADQMSSNWNNGHGHVWERPDGMKARCGGPGICSECAADQMRLREVESTQPWATLDIVMLLRAKDKAADALTAAEKKIRQLESSRTSTP